MKRKKPKASEEIEEMFATGDASKEPAKNEQAAADAGTASGESAAAGEESEEAAEFDTKTERAAAGEDISFVDNPVPDADASRSDAGDAAQMEGPQEQDAAPDATAEEPSSNQRFSDVLLEGAARIENAKRTGDRLAEAVGDFCRKALTKPDKLVGTANAFLIEGFREDFSRIARAVPEEFVLAAVERGHVDLAAALVIHWAATDDRALSGVVDRVIASPDRFARAESAGFLAGLARATGVMKPVRASELVSLAARVAGDDSRAACEEARKIVAAGEFLRQNAPEHRSFWKQQFAGSGPAWDSTEAANAIAKLRSCAGRGVAIPATMLEALPPEEREALEPESPEKTSPPAKKPKIAEQPKKPEEPEAREVPPDEEAPGLLPVRKATSDMPDFQNLRPVIRPPSRNPARFVIAVGVAAVVLLFWILWPGAEPAPDVPSQSSTVTPSASPSPAMPAVFSTTSEPAPAPASAANTPPAPATLPAPAPAAKSEPPPAVQESPPPAPASTPPAPAMRTPSEVADAKAAPAPVATTPPPPAPAAPSAQSAPAAQIGAGLPQWRRDRMAEEIRKKPEIERWYRSVKAGTWESSRKLLAGDVSFLPFQSDAHRGLVTLCTLDPPENAETRRALPRMAILTFPVADLVPLWEQIVADNGPDAPEVRNAAGLLVDVDQRSMPPHLAARLKKIAGRE